MSIIAENVARMNSLSAVNVKPVGMNCNLHCDYCYYRDVGFNYYMPTHILKNTISATLQLGSDNLAFIWHGGEPLLAGIDFYLLALSYIERFRRPTQHITHLIQTNATLINEQWADFFRENNFKVGVSLDGSEEMHDSFRKTRRGRSSWQHTINGIRLLIERGVSVGALGVITYRHRNKFRETFDCIVKSGIRSASFDPCCAPEYLLPWQDYANFMIGLFDYWLSTGTSKIKVEPFVDIIKCMLYKQSSMCWLNGNCNDMICVEANGTFVPGCDFLFSVLNREKRYLNKPALLNCIHNWAKGKEIKGMERNSPTCNTCRWNGICHGGCPRHRMVLPYKPLDRDYYCPAYKMIFSHIEKNIEKFKRRYRLT